MNFRNNKKKTLQNGKFQEKQEKDVESVKSFSGRNNECSLLNTMLQKENTRGRDETV